MAMTKKEKEAHDAIVARLELVSALRWTAPVLPDVLPPKKGAIRRVAGYAFDLTDYEVLQAWTGSDAHATYFEGSEEKEDGGLPLFSTRILALKAMRSAVEEKSASRLREIDRRIAFCEAEKRAGVAA